MQEQPDPLERARNDAAQAVARLVATAHTSHKIAEDFVARMGEHPAEDDLIDAMEVLQRNSTTQLNAVDAILRFFGGRLTTNG